MSTDRYDAHPDDYDPELPARNNLPPNAYMLPGGYQYRERNGLAIAGMVVGIVSIIFPIYTITAIVGLVLSLFALRRKDANGQPLGRGMAIAGIITSAVGILVGIISIILLVNVLAGRGVPPYYSNV
jgi:hypothetical protein